MPHPIASSRLAGHRFVLLLGAMLSASLVLASEAAAQNQTSSANITKLEIGFEGTYRLGKWTSVWVYVTAGESPLSGSLQVTTPDGDGVPATYTTWGAPLELASGETTRQSIYVKFGRSPTWLTVKLGDLERTFPVGSFPQPQPLSHEVILTLGGELEIAAAAELSRRRGQYTYLPCRQENTHLLPVHWFGYDSVDTIVLLTSNARYLRQWNDLQIEALIGWVQQGGRLIVSGGGELPARWAEVYPGEFAGIEVLRRTTALEVYAGATQRLDLTGSGRFNMPLTLLDDYRGRPTLVDQVAGESQPIFLLSPSGFGTILFSAIDLSAPPLDQWRDRPRLLLRLLRFGAESEVTPGDTGRSGGRVTHIGYQDMSGQLRAALEAFSFGGLSLIPFSWVAGLILLYIVLIGPAEYFFLRRIVGRMEYTWITFPLIAIALAVVAVLLTNLYKGNQLEVRQLTILDHDQTSGLTRQALWAHVYSPANARYEFSTTGEGNRLLSWHGLPGSGLGGMQNAAPAAGQQTQYELANNSDSPQMSIRPQAVPINVWSTKSFFGYRWSTTAKASAQENSSIAGLRETYDQRLLGEVENTTSYELVECQLLYDRWAYSIQGTVSPGDQIYLADERSPRDLEWKMTRRVVDEENKPVSTPWNTSNLDVPRIAEMMMFHQAAGGIGYTELTHRQLQLLDLSRHLKMGRAVLVGKTRTPTSRLTLDGEPIEPRDEAGWAYVRIIVPVQIQ